MEAQHLRQVTLAVFLAVLLAGPRAVDAACNQTAIYFADSGDKCSKALNYIPKNVQDFCGTFAPGMKECMRGEYSECEHDVLVAINALADDYSGRLCTENGVPKYPDLWNAYNATQEDGGCYYARGNGHLWAAKVLSCDFSGLAMEYSADTRKMVDFQWLLPYAAIQEKWTMRCYALEVKTLQGCSEEGTKGLLLKEMLNKKFGARLGLEQILESTVEVPITAPESVSSASFFGAFHLMAYRKEKYLTCENIDGIWHKALVLNDYVQLYWDSGSNSSIDQLDVVLYGKDEADEQPSKLVEYEISAGELRPSFKLLENGEYVYKNDLEKVSINGVDGEWVVIQYPDASLVVVITKYQESYPAVVVAMPVSLMEQSYGWMVDGCIAYMETSELPVASPKCVQACSGYDECRQEMCAYDCSMSGGNEVVADMTQKKLVSAEDKALSSYRVMTDGNEVAWGKSWTCDPRPTTDSPTTAPDKTPTGNAPRLHPTFALLHIPLIALLAWHMY